MPESLSLPHLTAGSFQLQPQLKLYVALLVRATPRCSRPTLTIQSFWLHKHWPAVCFFGTEMLLFELALKTIFAFRTNIWLSSKS